MNINKNSASKLIILRNNISYNLINFMDLVLEN